MAMRELFNQAANDDQVRAVVLKGKAHVSAAVMTGRIWVNGLGNLPIANPAVLMERRQYLNRKPLKPCAA